MTVQLDGSLPSLHGGLPAASVMEAARFAYRLLLRKFWTVLSLVWLPLVLASVSLYVCVMGYFTELLRYLANPAPEIASLALGLLALGVFVALFFWSVAIAAVTNLALGEAAPHTWLHLRARRQEWRLYAGYLRFLLLIGLLAGGLAFFFTSIEPLLPASSMSASILTLAIFAAIFWFTVRVSFLIPPIVATTSGTILRAAWRKSEGYGWRIAGLMLILLVPAMVAHGLGEFVLSQAGGPVIRSGSTVADYARAAEQGLGIFLIFFTIASFFAITLLTAGATAFFRQISQPRG